MLHNNIVNLRHSYLRKSLFVMINSWRQTTFMRCYGRTRPAWTWSPAEAFWDIPAGHSIVKLEASSMVGYKTGKVEVEGATCILVDI